MSTRTPRPGAMFKPKPARGSVPGDLAKGIAPKPPIPARPPTKRQGPRGPQPPKPPEDATPRVLKPLTRASAIKAHKSMTKDGQR